MDYSSALPEDPAHGSSPWASSPQHTKRSFSNAPSLPNSPLPPPAQSPYGENSQQTGFSEDTDTAASSAQLERSEEIGSSEQSQNDDQLEPSAGQQSDYQPRNYPDSGSQRPEPARYHSTTTRARAGQPYYKLQAKITGLERTNRKDPILRFDVQTNLPKFRTTQFRDVRRTHSEFQKLADHLISACPEALVPAVPPAATAAGVGTDEDEARVKASLQRWLNTVCGNDVLMRDEEMVFFVESDFGYSPVVRRKQPATGMKRKMLKQFAPPPDDTPELAEARPVVKLYYLGTMEAGQKVENVVKHRRALGLAEADLGVKMAQMAVQETHPGLANAYRKLGKVIQATGDFHAAQGTAEATTLGDPLTYQSADAFIVKETLTNRQLLIRELIQAQAHTRKALASADRLRASSSVRHDKVNEAISTLEEAKTTETYLTQKTERITKNLVQERRKWFARTAADLRSAIREYVSREIEAERRTLATLEQVRPDIRAIDSSGGLSRLGRESHPAVRRSNMASSQGPKGDAWSGVPRKHDSLNRTGSAAYVLPEGNVEEDDEATPGRKRAVSGAGSAKGPQDDDDDRIDARNAASRLATTTF